MVRLRTERAIPGGTAASAIRDLAKRTGLDPEVVAGLAVDEQLGSLFDTSGELRHYGVAELRSRTEDKRIPKWARDQLEQARAATRAKATPRGACPGCGFGGYTPPGPCCACDYTGLERLS